MRLICQNKSPSCKEIGGEKILSEWTVVTALVTLVGLGAAVLRPLICLNETITRLTEVVKRLEENMTELTEKNSRAHTKLWGKADEHDGVLGRHETRLAVIEAEK